MAFSFVHLLTPNGEGIAELRLYVTSLGLNTVSGESGRRITAVGDEESGRR